MSTGRNKQAPAARGRRWIAIGLGLLAITLGVAFYLQTRAPNVELSRGELLVSSFVYGIDVPLGDIESVSLELELPQVQKRTNGFAAWSTLRGHFRLAELGEGQLYVDRDRPPYIVVRFAGGYVIFNHPDPNRTRELYERLRVTVGGEPVDAPRLPTADDGAPMPSSNVHEARPRIVRCDTDADCLDCATPTGCQCTFAARDEGCPEQVADCVVDPCAGRQAFCVDQQCVMRSAPSAP